MEGLGVTGAAFHAAEAGEAKEDLVVPPVAGCLGREMGVQERGLSAYDLVRQRQIDRGTAEIPIPLGDLVVEDQRVPESGGASSPSVRWSWWRRRTRAR